MRNVWMRELKVVLTSEKFKKRIELGTKYDKDTGVELNQLDIMINCKKYLSALKDNCVIKIKNLSYSEIIPLLKGKYYGIEIKVGYRDLSTFTIFKGEVLYMSNNIIDNKTNELVILGASKLIARFGQNRLNMSLGSGMNIYSVLKFICNRSGIKNVNIDDYLKRRISPDSIIVNNTIQSFLETISNNYGCVINTDESNGSIVSILNPTKNKMKIIKLNNDNIQLENGYPTLDVDGVELDCKPLFNFSPGNIIQIDNSLLNISTTSYTHNIEEFSKDYYLDANGQYVIFEIDYNLTNRSDAFTCSIKGKSKTLLSNLGKGGR